MMFNLPDNLKLKRCRHGNMLFRSNDMYLGKSLDLYREFVESEVQLFAAIVTKEMLVVDAGANIGAHTIPLAQLADHVVAVEAQLSHFQMLCANIALNDLRNVSTIHSALGDRRGKTIIPGIDFDKAGNFGCVPAIGHTVGNHVSLITIDSLTLPRCDFIKIDVEGMEAAVIAGATATIARFRPIMFVENDRRELSHELIALLQRLNYRLYWFCCMLYNPQNYAGNATNEFEGLSSFNMICLPDDSIVMKNCEKVRGPDDWWDRFTNISQDWGKS